MEKMILVRCGWYIKCVDEEDTFISVINETSGSDGAVHVEIVTQGNSI